MKNGESTPALSVDDAIATIARGVSTEIGERFFKSLVENLVAVLDADYAMIGEVRRGPPEKISSIAAHDGGALVDHFEYDLKGTPCANVVGDQLCSYPGNVQEQFPDDHFLVELGMRSYVGAPLRDARQQITGLLVVLFKRSIEDAERVSRVLQVFCTWVSAEMERKRAEGERLLGERRMESALEGAEIGLWEWHIPTGETYYSPQYFQMLGYEPDELPHLLDTWKDLLHPNDRERTLVGLEQIFGQENPAWEIEFRMRRKDGSYSWILGKGRVLEKGPNGEHLKAAGTNLDITERKENEQRREMLEIQLRQAQKMEAIGVLAGGIAHDFNNILAAILGYTELTLLEPSLSEDAKQDLQEVLKASVRGRDLVQQILTFSRKADEKRTMVRIANVVQDAVNLLRQMIPSTVNLNLQLEKVPGTVLADLTQMQQVVINLMTNAFQAMGDTSGQITIGLKTVWADEVLVTKHAELSEGSYVLLTIQDTGSGIPEGIRARIFEPFFTTKAKGKGTGMGLAVVHGIIQSHGGALTLESEVGVGTTFGVYLPLQHAEEAEVPGLPDEQLPHGTERILFVDDEPDLAHLGMSVLEGLGYKVTARSSSVAALEIFEADPFHFDLLVTDQTMPEMTGIELAQKILANRPGMPVVICTGYSETVTAETAKAAGIKGYLMKPVERKTLAQTVRAVLDG